MGLSTKRIKQHLGTLTKRLRKRYKLKKDELLFLTFHPDKADLFLSVLDDIQPSGLVIDPDCRFKREAFFVSAVRIDEALAKNGEFKQSTMLNDEMKHAEEVAEDEAVEEATDADWENDVVEWSPEKDKEDGDQGEFAS